MVSVEAGDVPIDMRPAVDLYRGLNTWEERATRADLRNFALATRTPMPPGSAGFSILQDQGRPQRHVLKIVRSYVSLSLLRAIAVWYATHDNVDGKIYEKSGTLVTVRASRYLLGERLGCMEPGAWVDRDPDAGPHSVVLVDPRYLLALEHFDAWLEGRSRSLRDQEILLGRGRLVPIRFEPVTPADCTPGIVPWALSVYSDPSFDW